MSATFEKSTDGYVTLLVRGRNAVFFIHTTGIGLVPVSRSSAIPNIFNTGDTSLATFRCYAWLTKSCEAKLFCE
jgi:hypothetical protein